VSWDDDQPPYSMIGVQTTLPGKSKAHNRPIGFIWDRKEKPQRRGRMKKVKPKR
jgi:hypothetical protein